MHDIAGVIFDLDGVVTDTAEFHYQAWQKLADDNGWPFDRAVNDALRGVSRAASLDIILDGRTVTDERRTTLLESKNADYVSRLGTLTSRDVLPGVLDLLHDLRAQGIKIALGSASKNAPVVLEQLGIAGLFDAVVDGNESIAPKPAPDVFLRAAQRLGVAPGLCVVVEDAEAGVTAGLAAGAWTLGIGPASRVGHAHARVDDLRGSSVAWLRGLIEDAAWTIRDRGVDAADLQHRETVFTIGNGNFCVRGSFEEPHPGSNPGSFMHRVWDDMPVTRTELASLPRWWGVDLWLDGDRVRLDRGEILEHTRALNLRTGVLTRHVEWRANPGARVLVADFERVVDASSPHRAAVRVTVGTRGGAGTLRLRTGLDAHVENTGLLHWDVIGQSSSGSSAELLVRTRATKIDVALAAAVTVDGPAPLSTGTDADGAPATDHLINLAGSPVTLTKIVAVVPDFDAADPAAQAGALVADATWDAVRDASDAVWADLWEGADIEVDGDPEAQLALRYNLFQLLIAAPRFTDRASIGAKTLSGYGYRHHAFWDTEIFMLPFFVHTHPTIARNMLAYRWHCLPASRAKAAANGHQGAQFAWESAATGEEVTPTWVPHYADPTKLVRIWCGDIEVHITGDVAYAVDRYWRASGDDAFMREMGAEIVLDGASFWASSAELGEDGAYHYLDVIGPDEYHDRIDDNAYTNNLAAWHLEKARTVLGWLDATAPETAAELRGRLGIDDAALARWADVAARLYRPMDPTTGLVEQFAGYFGLQDVDLALARDPQRTISMQQIYGIEGVTQTQNIKQPDVLMLAYLLPELFTAEQERANYRFYDPRTDHEHGSSLGPSISAVLACRNGDPELGYQHFLRAARADLVDVRHNAADGIHGASAGGLWQAAVFGFAGLRAGEQGLETSPALPPSWKRLTFSVTHRGTRQRITVRPDGRQA